MFRKIIEKFYFWLLEIQRRLQRKIRNAIPHSSYLWILVLVTGAGLIVLYFFWGEFSVLMRDVGKGTLNTNPISNMEIMRNIGLTLAALFGLWFTWWRSKCLDRQAHVKEQELITDRFIKATDQLGSENEVLRIAAFIVCGE